VIFCTLKVIRLPRQVFCCRYQSQWSSSAVADGIGLLDEYESASSLSINMVCYGTMMKKILQNMLLVAICFVLGGESVLLASTRTHYHEALRDYRLTDSEKSLTDSIRHRFGMLGVKMVKIDSRIAKTARAEAGRVASLPKGAHASQNHDDLRQSLRLNGVTDYQIHGTLACSEELQSITKELISFAEAHAWDGWTHFGVGLQNVGNLNCGVVIFVNRLVHLESLAKSFSKPGRVTIKGELSQGVGKSAIHITYPNGKVKSERLPKYAMGRFSYTEDFKKSGRYTVEILGKMDGGPKVAALFDLCIGSKCASSLEPPPFRLVGGNNKNGVTKSIVAWVNALRAQYVRHALKSAPLLARIEQEHVDELAAENKISHVDKAGLDVGEKLKKSGVEVVAYGENLGKNSGLEALLLRLADSPSHRRNLLSPRFTHIGIGVNFSESNNLWIVGQLFARLPKTTYQSSELVEPPLAFWKMIHQARDAKGLPPIHHLGRLARVARLTASTEMKSGKINRNRLTSNLKKNSNKHRQFVNHITVFEVADFRSLARSSIFFQKKWTLVGMSILRLDSGDLLVAAILGSGNPK